MADCNDTLRELELFLDQELSETARLEIHQHLAGCPDCLQAFDFHAELKIVIAAKCHNDEMPPGLMSKIASCFGEDFSGADDEGAADPDDLDATADITDGPAAC
jgi:mycothiol system anti-sigma-R factor